MTLKVVPSKNFIRDIKVAKKRGCDIRLLRTVVNMLAARMPLPKKNKDHQLKGNYAEFRECHIQPDWLLIYRVEEDNLLLFLLRTGTHADLF